MVTAFEVGFFSTQNNGNADSNFGFWRQNGKYHEVNFPAKHTASPPVDQLLGIDDSGTAVGFFNDNAGNSHGYAYNITTKKFTLITVPGATSLTAAAINDKGTAPAAPSTRRATPSPSPSRTPARSPRSRCQARRRRARSA